MEINTVTETSPLTSPLTAAKSGIAMEIRTEMETRPQSYSPMARNNGVEMGNYTATKAPLLFGQLAYKNGGVTENVMVTDDKYSFLSTAVVRCTFFEFIVAYNNTFAKINSNGVHREQRTATQRQNDRPCNIVIACAQARRQT
jgi:hypothetical protein